MKIHYGSTHVCCIPWVFSLSYMFLDSEWMQLTTLNLFFCQKTVSYTVNLPGFVHVFILGVIRNLHLVAEYERFFQAHGRKIHIGSARRAGD